MRCLGLFGSGVTYGFVFAKLHKFKTLFRLFYILQISARTSAPCVTGDYEFSNIQQKFFNVYMEQRVETLIRHTM